MNNNKYRIWYAFKIGGERHMLYFPVKQYFDLEAKAVIDALSERDNLDENVDFNAFGLEEWDEIENDWSEYYDEEGKDIIEIIKNIK